jgi:hypothetical protein
LWLSTDVVQYSIDSHLAVVCAADCCLFLVFVGAAAGQLVADFVGVSASVLLLSLLLAHFGRLVLVLVLVLVLLLLLLLLLLVDPDALCLALCCFALP